LGKYLAIKELGHLEEKRKTPGFDRRMLLKKGAITEIIRSERYMHIQKEGVGPWAKEVWFCHGNAIVGNKLIH